MENRTNIKSSDKSYGLILEESASFLTKGKNGYGAEGVMKWYP